jgi:hypothetical protein
MKKPTFGFLNPYMHPHSLVQSHTFRFSQLFQATELALIQHRLHFMDIRIIVYETSTQIFRVGVEDAVIKVHDDRSIIASVLEAATSHELMAMIFINVDPGQHTIQRNIHLAKFLIQAINLIHFIQFLKVEEEFIIVECRRKRRKRLERGKAQKSKDFTLRISIHCIRVWRGGGTDLIRST